MLGKCSKGGFLNGQSQNIVTVKLGSDLVVGDLGVNTLLLNQIAEQQYLLWNKYKTRCLNITSGAGKLGKLIAIQNGKVAVSKQEAAFLGFDLVMNAWRDCFSAVGLQSVTVSLTGHDLTKNELKRHQELLKDHQNNSTFVLNVHDGLNSKRYRYYKEATNNDIVGEKFADLVSDTYIICTNVDGVFNRYGQTIRYFNNLSYLDTIEFGDVSVNGTGGMREKLFSAIRFAQSKVGRRAFIVDGNEKDVLLKVLCGETVGTQVQF